MSPLAHDVVDGPGESPVRVLPCGPTAVLLEVASTSAAVELHGWLTRQRLAGVRELLPAARTVLVEVAAERLDAVVAAVAGYRPAGAERPAATGDPIEIPVVYDGADLAETARICAMSPQEVVARHAAPTYTAAFCGFAPGFAYLVGGDPALRIPRRAEPRTRVPAGSVAVAGEFSAVYPTASPGGWHLLGHTDATVWDLTRDPPALLPPGTRVRFVRVGGTAG